jgi:lysophospholipase L1-like esterase
LARAARTHHGEWVKIERIVATCPDVVLIEFSLNDASWLKGVSLRQSRRNTEEIVARLLGALPLTTIYLMTMNPVYGLRRWIRPRLKAYYDLYGELAKGLWVGHIDSRPAWNRLTRPQLTIAIHDGLHPIPEYDGSARSSDNRQGDRSPRLTSG